MGNFGRAGGLAGLALVGGACSEWQLFGREDVPGDDPEAPDDACDAYALPPQEVGPSDACPDPGPLALVPLWTLDVGMAYGPPLVVQLDGAGPPEVIIGTADNRLVVATAGSERYAMWTSALDGVGSADVGDLDGDGRVEVVAQLNWASDNAYTLRAWNDRGAVLWTTEPLPEDLNPTYGMPSIDDLDGDGLAEVIAGRVIFRHDGRIRGIGAFGRGAVVNPAVPDVDYGGCAYGVDLDGDGQQEVLAGNTAYDADGGLFWKADAPDGLTAAADFDGDGAVEIVLVSFNELRGLSAEGDVQWGPVVVDPACAHASAPALGDLDGDGRLEVAIADHSAVRVFSGADGVERWTDTHASNTMMETPSFADFDGDGDIDLLVGSWEPGRGLVAYGLTSGAGPGRAIWSQHAWRPGAVEVDGTIPADNTWWPTPNAFRSAGATATAGFDVRPVVVDVCADRCADGVATVSARLENRGPTYVPPGVTLEIVDATGQVLASATAGGLARGWTSEAFWFDVPAERLARGWAARANLGARQRCDGVPEADDAAAVCP